MGIMHPVRFFYKFISLKPLVYNFRILCPIETFHYFGPCPLFQGAIGDESRLGEEGSCRRFQMALLPINVSWRTKLMWVEIIVFTRGAIYQRPSLWYSCLPKVETRETKGVKEREDCTWWGAASCHPTPSPQPLSHIPSLTHKWCCYLDNSLYLDLKSFYTKT